MWNRILVPLDGSTRAERALPVAAQLARASGGAVYLVRVVRAPVEFELGAVGPAIWAPAADPDERIKATTYLSLIATREVFAGVPTFISVYAGAVAPTLLHIACTQQADVIVMSSQGRQGFSPWGLGSTAQRVAREAFVPVLVLRASPAIPSGFPAPDPRPIRALVALDGSMLAETALAPAAHLVAALSAPATGALHLAGIASSPRTIAEARAYLRGAAQGLHTSDLASLDLSISSSVELHDDIAAALVKRAEEGLDSSATQRTQANAATASGAGAATLDGAGAQADEPCDRCDLIALATHGRGGLQRWAMGSVTERVLASTRLPVLIVRPTSIAATQLALRGEVLDAATRMPPDPVSAP